MDINFVQYNLSGRSVTTTSINQMQHGQMGEEARREAEWAIPEAERIVREVNQATRQARQAAESTGQQYGFSGSIVCGSTPFPGIRFEGGQMFMGGQPVFARSTNNNTYMPDGWQTTSYTTTPAARIDPVYASAAPPAYRTAPPPTTHRTAAATHPVMTNAARPVTTNVSAATAAPVATRPSYHARQAPVHGDERKPFSSSSSGGGCD